MIGKIITWLRKDGAALCGLLLALVRSLREVLVTVVRIFAIFLPDSFVEDVIIAKVSGISDFLEGGLKKATDFLLGLIG